MAIDLGVGSHSCFAVMFWWIRLLYFHIFFVGYLPLFFPFIFFSSSSPSVHPFSCNLFIRTAKSISSNKQCVIFVLLPPPCFKRYRFTLNALKHPNRSHPQLDLLLTYSQLLSTFPPCHSPLRPFFLSPFFVFKYTLCAHDTIVHTCVHTDLAHTHAGRKSWQSWLRQIKRCCCKSTRARK